ncbi:MAG: hypothetical protein HYS13_21550 [Planctomycetia bacterium]|nr:hypothetical protein [Planctomycetia bacterium]
MRLSLVASTLLAGMMVAASLPVQRGGIAQADETRVKEPAKMHLVTVAVSGCRDRWAAHRECENRLRPYRG